MTDMLSFILITTVQMPCVLITSFSCYSLSQQPVILLWPSLSLVISGYSLYFNTSNTSCPCSPHIPTLFMLSCGWTRLCSWTGYPMDLTVQPCLFTAVVTEENLGLDIKHWLVPLLKVLEPSIIYFLEEWEQHNLSFWSFGIHWNTFLIYTKYFKGRLALVLIPWTFSWLVI